MGLTGVPRDLRSVSTTSLQLLYLEVILPRLPVRCACYPTLQLLQKLGQDLITSLTSCMPRELSFIGMLEKEWRKVSSLKLEKILLLLKRIMKRLVLIPVRLMMMREERNTELNSHYLLATMNCIRINHLT